MSLVFNSAIKKKSILLDNRLGDKYQNTNLSLQMFGGDTYNHSKTKLWACLRPIIFYAIV